MNKNLAVGLSVVSFVVGTGVGFYLTPEYTAMKAENKSSMVTLGMADREIDKRYLQNMIAHHLSAIDLLKQAQQNSKRPEIKKLAEDVITADQKDIERLYGLLDQWYPNGYRRQNDFDKINLGEGDEKFDLRLLNALIAHHEMAIMSAEEMMGKTTKTEVLNTADTVKTNLSAGLVTLTNWRKEWYGIK
jgi:uncharacterized protein (DUF305 family)